MSEATNLHPTRESWLNHAAELLHPWFVEAGSPINVPIRITVGFPSTSALSIKKPRVGECWSPESSKSGHAEIFISPVLEDVNEVLGVVAHELGHAALGNEVGHKKPFARLMVKLNLEGKATATIAGAAFRARATSIIDELGPFPHSRLSFMGKEKKKRKTAYLKCQCSTCGYAAWTTKKWVDVGLPDCPTDRIPLVCESADDESEED